MKTNYDRLHTPANVFYERAFYSELTKEQGQTRQALDIAGQELFDAAARDTYTKKAKKQDWYRRTYTPTYLTKDKEGTKWYMDSFEQVGTRFFEESKDGWYADDIEHGVIRGVVLFIKRHTGQNINDWGRRSWGEIEYEGAFMAGTTHDDYDGVTLYNDTFDTYQEALRYANRRAEREAEICREEDIRYRREEDIRYRREEEISDRHADIRNARRGCLALLREVRSYRKGLIVASEVLIKEMRLRVESYLDDIRDNRKAIAELKKLL